MSKPAYQAPRSGELKRDPPGAGWQKGGIDDAIRRDAEDKFAFVDAGRQTRFRQQAVVGGVVELEDAFQGLSIVREPGEYRCPAVGELRRNQPMGIALIDRGSGRK